MEVDLVGISTTDPLQGSFSRLSLSPSCASGFAFRLHGVKHNTPSPTAGLLLASLSSMAGLPLDARKKVGSPKKNCAYSLQDKIVFVDLRVNCFFGCFPHPLDGGGGWVPICGFSSDLDQNRAVLWSKSEMKHLKHPKHLKHLKHCLWMFGLLFCQHFKELGGKVKDGVHGRQDQ